MVVISPPPPALAEALSLFYVRDNLLSNSPVLVFYGSSNTAVTGPTNSRIQAHIFATAGFQSYPRLALSPSSPLYAAVNCLSREEQRDEVCRGLAFALYKYFSELPSGVKDAWKEHRLTTNRSFAVSKIFGEDHAASLASRMIKVENIAEVITDIQHSLAEQSLSWLDVDIVLPPGSMQEAESRTRDSSLHVEIKDESVYDRYGAYAPLIRLFGEPAFLPTSKLRRAPSRLTAVSRTHSFSKRQKENLRREMCEFVDTEERYVSKIHDLVHSIAKDFREKAMARATSSASPSEETLSALFPPSLDEILTMSSAFLEAIRGILEETETDAIKDIETGETGPTQGLIGHSADLTGVSSFADCLLTWFPRFATCYGDYISAHANFAQLLRSCMKDTVSSFSKRIQDTGEQRLMSMLIEPVQRLPRYTLYIDNITKQLPAGHPALKHLLKARDIVTDICSQDLAVPEHSKTVGRLREVVSSWPQAFSPQGRLISAVDVFELPPPFRQDAAADFKVAGLLLLFAGYLVFIRRPSPGGVTARRLLSELSQQTLGISGVGSFPGDHDANDLSFHTVEALDDVTITELHKGATIQIMPSGRNSDDVNGKAPDTSFFGVDGVRTFLLSGSYEGKAARFAEEVVKARVEARFGEAERETAQWEAWSAQDPAGGLGLFAAIFEEGEGQVPDGRGSPAQVRIVIDETKGAKKIPASSQGVMITASLTVVGEGFYKLEIEGLNDFGTRDHLTATEFLPVLSKRLSNLLQIRNRIGSPLATVYLLRRNYAILQSLNIVAETQDGEVVRPKTPQELRPISPVKMLSNLFGTGTSKGAFNSRKAAPPMPNFGEIPRLPMPSQQSAAVRQHAEAVALDFLRKSVISPPTDKKATVIDSGTAGSAITPVQRLEQTLASYTLALHARKGNVVGRVLLNRAAADELAVNELYNTLLEDPTNYQVVAEASVDVLFAAFEKFLRIAWKDQIGPVVDTSTLAAIQSKSESLFSGAFEDYFKTILASMAPQNQRAFKAILKLLADLLDGTGNDGDRGILTAAFADLLVAQGNAHDFMSLLDRFVEDLDLLFVENRPMTSQEPAAADNRARATNAGSVSSNTSSLRKRFGLGTLNRENSKNESESKLASVLRTLSKPNRNAEMTQPSSLSKVSLQRSQSTDIDPKQVNLKRPSSRDRPTVLGAFSFEDRPTSSGRPLGDVFKLSTIGESQGGSPPRKKRRSSLSDLKTLQSSNITPSWSPSLTPRKGTDSLQRGIPRPSPSPRIPSPTKVTNITGPTLTSGSGGSPSSMIPSLARGQNSPIAVDRKENFPRPTTSRKESSPTSMGNVHTLKERPAPYTNENLPPKSMLPSKQRVGSITSTSTFKSPPPLTERPTSGNALKPLIFSPEKTISSPPRTTRRLRMQSPQKLRERLQTEQKSVAAAEAGLRAELSKIGEQISAASARAPPSATDSPADATPPSLTDLQTRLSAVQASIPQLLKPVQDALAELGNDITSSLLVSETKARQLDELYREANAENEALYARFNDELAKISARLKPAGGAKSAKTALSAEGKGEAEGWEEMKRLFAEAREDVASGKREVGRLRRENLGLRAQLREG